MLLCLGHIESSHGAVRAHMTEPIFNILYFCGVVGEEEELLGCGKQSALWRRWASCGHGKRRRIWWKEASV